MEAVDLFMVLIVGADQMRPSTRISEARRRDMIVMKQLVVPFFGQRMRITASSRILYLKVFL
jgi:hypothetical protein